VEAAVHVDVDLAVEHDEAFTSHLTVVSEDTARGDRHGGGEVFDAAEISGPALAKAVDLAETTEVVG
jgi:hypothetical protein